MRGSSADYRLESGRLDAAGVLEAQQVAGHGGGVRDARWDLGRPVPLGAVGEACLGRERTPLGAAFLADQDVVSRAALIFLITLAELEQRAFERLVQRLVGVEAEDPVIAGVHNVSAGLDPGQALLDGCA